jgi:hypothetical protein
MAVSSRSALGAVLVACLSVGAATAQQISEDVRRSGCAYAEAESAELVGQLARRISVAQGRAIVQQLRAQAAQVEALYNQLGPATLTSMSDPRYSQMLQTRMAMFELAKLLGVSCETGDDEIACSNRLVERSAEIVGTGEGQAGDVARGRQALDRLRALRTRINELQDDISSLARTAAGTLPGDRMGLEAQARESYRLKDAATQEMVALAATFGVACPPNDFRCPDRLVADVERIVGAAETADLLGEATDAASGRSRAQRAFEQRRNASIQQRIAWNRSDMARLGCGNLRVAGAPASAPASAGQLAGTWYVWGVPGEPRFEISQSGASISWQIGGAEGGTGTVSGETVSGIVSGSGGNRSVAGTLGWYNGEPVRISWDDGRVFARVPPGR